MSLIFLFRSFCYVLLRYWKKATALFEIQPLFLFWIIRKRNQSFSKDSSTKKAFTHVQFLSFWKFPFFFRKTKKNTPKMQKRYTCHVSYYKNNFISININLQYTPNPNSLQFEQLNKVQQPICFAFIHFRRILQIISLKIVRFIIRTS